MSEILLHEVSYAYPEGPGVFKRLDLRIPARRRAVLRGPLGCGKTTLLRLIVGALPGKHEGAVLVGDLELAPRTLPEIRRRVGLVPANPDEMLFMPTLLEEIAFAPLNYGRSRKDAEALAVDLMQRFGLTELADKPPYRLSDGQKRLAAVAAVLAQQPEWLLLDEPTVNLDAPSREKLMSRLREFDGGILAATHEDRLAPELGAEEVNLPELGER